MIRNWLDNVLVINEDRYDQVKPSCIQAMDVVVIKKGPNTYSIIKNRFDAGQIKDVSWKTMEAVLRSYG